MIYKQSSAKLTDVVLLNKGNTYKSSRNLEKKAKKKTSLSNQIPLFSTEELSVFVFFFSIIELMVEVVSAYIQICLNHGFSHL